MLASQLVAIGTQQQSLLLLNRIPVTYTAGITASTAAAVVASAAVTPGVGESQAFIPGSADLSAGGIVATPWMSPSNLRVWQFVLGHATAADGTTCTVKIWGQRPIRAAEASAARPMSNGNDMSVQRCLLAELALTAGSNAIPANAIIEPTLALPDLRCVDTIVVSKDYTRNQSVKVYRDVSTDANMWAAVEHDSEGFGRYLIEMQPASGVGAWAFGVSL